MKHLKDIIISKSAGLKDELINIRRHIHRNPELSFEEYATASFIADRLDEYGISYRNGITGTGIIAEIKGNLDGNMIIGLRAEMDALPVLEKNTLEYSSKVEGKMHACGHDAHMAMLLGTAKILNSARDDFGGTILFIFQPGEELAPGGARLMIESGAFDDKRPDIVIAHHVLPELETGKVGYRPGMYMASSDEIYITISGKGGHAALPHLITDQIYIASRLVIRLKDQITASESLNNIPTVLGIGRIIGEGATNVIPEKVELAGTFRTFDEKWRAEAKSLIRKISAETAREFNVEIGVRIVDGYPVLVNDAELTARAVMLSRELLGDNMVESFDLRMSSEDFAFFTQSFPSLYYRVGIRKKGESPRMLHSPEFDIDEEALVTGVSNMCWLVLNYLNYLDLQA